jgi:hypothetical protein
MNAENRFYLLDFLQMVTHYDFLPPQLSLVVMDASVTTFMHMLVLRHLTLFHILLPRLV